MCANFEAIRKNRAFLLDLPEPDQLEFPEDIEPYRVCRRPLFLRECPDEKSKIHP